ncbi:hypothetical protein F4677DRAFT_120982 [Hypoxylon crocopeplum]|nr:hypothetical protein F4677DRAFT_120982 [Hypoxylon crocopeplum]
MTGNNLELSQFLDDDRFHRTFTLPIGPGRSEEFKVTYSDFGYQNPENPGSERVLLFCGPLMGSRFLFIAKDKLAKQYGVRVINADRPGFGGTSKVEMQDRVRVWLEIVPALLQHLGIAHVSIAAHSCGAVYAVNTLLHLRHLLHPTRPYVAFCAPWVHPSHSGVSLLKLAHVLPDSLVGSFDRIVNFFQASVNPAIQSSSGLIGKISASREEREFLAPGVDPADVEFEENLHQELFRRINAESIQGLGQDSLLLLKRTDDPEFWGTELDYDKLVPRLAKTESELNAGTTDAAAAAATTLPLRVDVFFAESDIIIGTGAARQWFDDCWRAEQRGERITYSSAVVPKSNHDNLLDLRYGVPERIFQAMGGPKST